jgi:hypothetical protein
MQQSNAESHQTSRRLGDLFQERPPDASEEQPPSGFTKEFADFYRIAANFGLSTCIALSGGNQLHIDPTQQRSFWILWHWWLTFRQQLEVSSDAPASNWPRHAAEGKWYELEEVSTYSDYYFAAWTLFQCEFFDTGNPFPQKELYERRIDAALHSACYYTAKLCMNGAADNASLQNTDHAVHRRVLGSQELSGSHPSCYTGSSVDPCAWIEDASDVPFYLWDVKKRCTIEVQTLEVCPSYTAISHTWGRWRINSSTELPGVTGWRIPQNSLFDVATLPDLLAEVPVLTSFIWFDLVCIPQLRSDRSNKEIAKQASIFRQAVHTII